MARTHLRLTETVALPAPSRVDMAGAVVYGVKLLGWKSRNDREYVPEGVDPALYRGKWINANHPVNPNTGRPEPHRGYSVYDRFCKVVNAYKRDDGIYGDVRCLKRHPLTPTFLEAAATADFHDAFGMSHNAEGEGEYEGGTFVVQKVTEVRNVDLVCDGGTTRGLYEQHTPEKPAMRITLAELLEKVAPDRAARVRKLIEADYMAPEMSMDVTEPEGGGDTDHEAALDQGIESALHALASALVAGDLDIEEAVKRFREIAKAHGKIKCGGKSDADDAPADDSEPAGDDAKPMESLRRENAQLKGLVDLLEFCVTEKIDRPSGALFEAIQLIPDTERRKAALLETRALARTRAPESHAPGGTRKDKHKPPASAQEFAAKILNPAVEG